MRKIRKKYTTVNTHMKIMAARVIVKSNICRNVPLGAS